MNQDEIYNLLLIILLMSNERENDTDATVRTAQGSINELIIASLLINSCNSNDTTNPSNCNCGRNNGNTTF